MSNIHSVCRLISSAIPVVGFGVTTVSFVMAGKGMKREVYDRIVADWNKKIVRKPYKVEINATETPKEEATDYTLLFAFCVHGYTIASSLGTVYYGFFKQEVFAINASHYVAGVLSWGYLAKTYTDFQGFKKAENTLNFIDKDAEIQQRIKDKVTEELKKLPHNGNYLAQSLPPDFDTKFDDEAKKEIEEEIEKKKKALQERIDYHHFSHCLVITSVAAQALGYFCAFPPLAKYISPRIKDLSAWSFHVSTAISIGSPIFHYMFPPPKDPAPKSKS